MVVVANETNVKRMMTITTRTMTMSASKNEKQDQNKVGVLEPT
jgi:hypothetical protein